MTAAAITVVAAGQRASAADAAAVLAMAVGAICLLGWIGRLGFLANLLSRPVLIGYMNGIALLMIISQLGNVTGVKADGGSFGQQLWSVVTHLHLVHPPTLVVGSAVLAMLFVIAWRFPRIPDPLIAMILAGGCVALFDLVRSRWLPTRTTS